MDVNLFQFKYYCLKPNTRKFYLDLKKNQYLSQDEIESISWNKTRRLLHYAYEKVPYYRKKYDSTGMHPNDIKTSEDYHRIPFLTKEDIRKNTDAMISSEASLKDLNTSTTGGSTGQVLKLYHQRNVPRAAIGWRMMNWWGVPPGTDTAWIWRMGRPSILNRIALKIIEWPSRSIQLNAARLDSQNMKDFIKAYNASNIQLVHGYVGAVNELASFILDNKLTVRAPKAVSVTSSPITLLQEKRIEKAFGAPVYDQYGCSEVFWLAAQCNKKKGLHRFHDTRRIEFIGDDNLPCADGEQGKIVITNLEAYYFPIIRYLVGDLGRSIPGKCECGVNLPLMEKVSGRSTDIIKMPDGASISGDYLTTIFDDYPDEIIQFQVHQQKTGDIVIRYIPAMGQQQDIDAITEKVYHKCQKDFCNRQVKINFEKVDEIPHIRGKLVYIMSEYGK